MNSEIGSCVVPGCGFRSRSSDNDSRHGLQDSWCRRCIRREVVDLRDGIGNAWLCDGDGFRFSLQWRGTYAAVVMFSTTGSISGHACWLSVRLSVTWLVNYRWVLCLEIFPNISSDTFRFRLLTPSAFRCINKEICWDDYFDSFIFRWVFILDWTGNEACRRLLFHSLWHIKYRPSFL